MVFPFDATLAKAFATEKLDKLLHGIFFFFGSNIDPFLKLKIFIFLVLIFSLIIKQGFDFPIPYPICSKLFTE